MSWVAVAIGGAAVVGAGAAISGGKQAANAQIKGDKQAIAEQRRQFDTIQQMQQPYYQTGVGALNMMSALYGMPAQTPYGSTSTPAQPTQGAVLDQFRNMPGYQFGMKEGTTAVEQGSAARSGVLGGNALRGVNAFAQDYAGTKLGEEWGRLKDLAFSGQQSANATSNAAQNTGANVAQLYSNAGDARASGILGQYNGVSNALNTGLNNWMLYRGGYFG